MEKKSLRQLIESSFTVVEFKAFGKSIGWKGGTWTARRIDNPQTISAEHLAKLSEVLQVPIATLVNDYNVATNLPYSTIKALLASDTMTAAPASPATEQAVAETPVAAH